MSQPLLFSPFQSRPSSSFWLELQHQKLHTLRLSEEPIRIEATFVPGSSLVELLDKSILPPAPSPSSTPTPPPPPAAPLENERVLLSGSLTLLNTSAAFKKLDKNEFLSSSPSSDLLSVLCFADLKKHTVVYWAAFPAVPGVTDSSSNAVLPYALAEAPSPLPAPELSSLDDLYLSLRLSLAAHAPMFFVLPSGSLSLTSLASASAPAPLLTLDDWMSSSPASPDISAPLFGYVGGAEPPAGRSWVLRSLLSRLHKFYGERGCSGAVLNVVSYQPKLRRLGVGAGGALEVGAGGGVGEGGAAALLKVDVSAWAGNPSADGGPVVGWELNAQGRPGPRIVDVNGVVLSIPMPGHPIASEQEEADTKKLAGLIKSHTVTYLLTDTRESRWLPTVIASSENKPLINVALGLGSWVVVRHGRGIDPPTEIPLAEADESAEQTYERANNLDKERLGCYFCSDVVAPANSMTGRTLDQQCTVTRPGLAPIAASMGVELMVGMAHRTADGDKGALGDVPGVIRGELAEWKMMNSNTPSFSCCTACSPAAVEAWREEGFGFVRKVAADDGSWLEKLCGLQKLKESAMDVDWDEDGDSDEDF
ncbi:hypothetical protein TeGR_g6162 [Tetraparma gracilis]|uniref:Ubiquitin-like modifier-activating enzyme Atg7 N-terminal domain-containing protein n=1 Tax=Tetraparma gracilis TaxID=2962635 RepID=A0ABQ6N9H0_9STRA|nr:hypothetical protein TeGR_g6162 [Tetraparma gracilis]